MATDRRVALMSASLTLAAILGPAALLGARALAFAPPPSPPPLVDTCAPGSCSIVVKTAEGGAPSRVIPVTQPSPVRAAAPVLIASADRE
mgnify:CR=1 FL=1